MIQTITQVLAIVAGAALVRALLIRLGVELRFEQALAVGVLVFLAILSGWFLRERWNYLDDQRERNSDVSPQEAAATCVATGVDVDFLSFVGSKIPVRERYYMEASGALAGAGDICIRFQLLPRLAVGDSHKARYLIFWEAPSRTTFEFFERRGAQVFKYDRDHFVLRKP
ncbi:MAG: hypothetical protein M3340_04250 [Actinomycetota bacterium]|nr:hypothetical protein [Actinomycetota bacterium]